MCLLHLANGTDDLHEKDQDELNERNILSLLIVGSDFFEKRKNLDFPQVVEEEVKQTGFIQGENGIHFLLMKQMGCHLGIVSFGGMPKEWS